MTTPAFTHQATGASYQEPRSTSGKEAWPEEGPPAMRHSTVATWARVRGSSGPKQPVGPPVAGSVKPDMRPWSEAWSTQEVYHCPEGTSLKDAAWAGAGAIAIKPRSSASAATRAHTLPRTPPPTFAAQSPHAIAPLLSSHRPPAALQRKFRRSNDTPGAVMRSRQKTDGRESG